MVGSGSIKTNRDRQTHIHSNAFDSEKATHIGTYTCTDGHAHTDTHMAIGYRLHRHMRIDTQTHTHTHTAFSIMRDSARL